MRRAVFLDRDGVLNKLVVRDGRALAPLALAEFVLLPGVRRAVEALRDASLLAVVVTNQPDVARGALGADELRRMHERLRRAVPVDAIYTCLHDDPDGCACRKPKPGLLLGAADEWKISLKDSWVVGDSWKDIEAGKAAACTTFLVDPLGLEPARGAPDFVVRSLSAAVRAILQEFHRAGSPKPGKSLFPQGGAS